MRRIVVDDDNFSAKYNIIIISSLGLVDIVECRRYYIVIPTYRYEYTIESPRISGSTHVILNVNNIIMFVSV